MSKTAMSKTDVSVITLPDIIDLDALDAVRDQMLETLDHGPLTVDASRVERVATNVIIMLLSAAETARRNAFAFSLVNQSEAMRAAIARLGLTASFAELTGEH